MSPKKVQNILLKDSSGKFVEFQNPIGGYTAGQKVYVRDAYMSGATCYASGWAAPNMQTVQNFNGTSKTEVRPLTTLEINRVVKGMGKEEYMRLSYPGGMSIGTDPEVFVVDENDVIIPAFTFLPKKPGSLSPAIPYWDGFQAEWNTPKDYTCLAYVTDYVHHGLEATYHAAIAKNPKAKLSVKTVLEIPQHFLEKEKEEYVELGCSPSKNAYGHEPLNVPNARTLGIRFAGCHLHMGLNRVNVPKYTQEEFPVLVKALDSVIGIIMTSMCAGLEDPRRRIFYGRAGEFRTPAHGLEWRVPSSAIISHPIAFHITFDLTRVVIGIAKCLNLKHVWNVREETVRRIINETDHKKAKKLLEKNLDTLQALIKTKYGYYGSPAVLKRVENIIIGGIANEFDLSDFNKVWHIKATPSHAGLWAGHCGSKHACVERLTR